MVKCSVSSVGWYVCRQLFAVSLFIKRLKIIIIITIFKTLGFANPIPRNLGEPCVECNGHAFLIASPPTKNK